MRRRLLLWSPLLGVALAVRAAEPFTNAATVLLQPDALMLARVESAAALAAYIRQVEQAAGASLANVFQRKPAGGFVVVAIKPGLRSRVWLDLDTPLPLATQDLLRAGIEAVPPPAVKEGVVVFAFQASFWGGRPPTRSAPAPAEWKAEAARVGQKLEVGELVARLWTD